MTCPCVEHHTPVVSAPHRHHVLPLAWGGKDYRTIGLCPTTHEATHDLLNHYVRAGGVPPWSTRRRFNRVARALAAEAWERRPSDRPPLTTPQGVAP